MNICKHRSLRRELFGQYEGLWRHKLLLRLACGIYLEWRLQFLLQFVVWLRQGCKYGFLKLWVGNRALGKLCQQVNDKNYGPHIFIFSMHNCICPLCVSRFNYIQLFFSAFAPISAVSRSSTLQTCVAESAVRSLLYSSFPWTRHVVWQSVYHHLSHCRKRLRADVFSAHEAMSDSFRIVLTWKLSGNQKRQVALQSVYYMATLSKS